MVDNITPPLKITIPVPSYIPPKPGMHSTSKYGGNLRIRCSNAELDMVQEEADKLGLTTSGFCRWCITRVALALRQYQERNQDGIHHELAGEDDRQVERRRIVG